jgi:hypothetical protein
MIDSAENSSRDQNQIESALCPRKISATSWHYHVPRAWVPKIILSLKEDRVCYAEIRTTDIDPGGVAVSTPSNSRFAPVNFMNKSKVRRLWGDKMNDVKVVYSVMGLRPTI